VWLELLESRFPVSLVNMHASATPLFCNNESHDIFIESGWAYIKPKADLFKTAKPVQMAGGVFF
jgi:hypothetical protein